MKIIKNCKRKKLYKVALGRRARPWYKRLGYYSEGEYFMIKKIKATTEWRSVKGKGLRWDDLSAGDTISVNISSAQEQDK